MTERNSNKSDLQIYKLLEHLQNDLKRISKFKTHAYLKSTDNNENITKNFQKSEETIQTLITSYVENFSTPQLSEYFNYKAKGDSKTKKLFSKSKQSLSTLPSSLFIPPKLKTSNITNYKPEHQKGSLLVNIIGLKHLPLRKFKKKVNPFVILKLNDKIKMTDRKFGESDPVFDKYFKFKTKGNKDKLRMIVYHKSNSNTKVIGNLEVMVKDVVENDNRLYKSMFINDKNSTMEFDIIYINR